VRGEAQQPKDAVQALLGAGGEAAKVTAAKRKIRSSKCEIRNEFKIQMFKAMCSGCFEHFDI
jgi:hypothetical protein